MELMIEKLLGFVMVLTRVSAFFLVAPFFSWKAIPVRLKIPLVLLISVFISMAVPFADDVRTAGTLKAVLLISNEALYGLALGLIVVIIFTVVKFSGRIAERQMGLAMAQVLDPLTGDSGQPLGTLLETMFILLFLSANGHHLFLLIISRSYAAFPAGSIPAVSALTGGIIEAGSTMMIAGLRLAAPLLGAFLLMMVALAVLARVAPEMNILFISFPLRVGLGLLMAGVFLPFVSGFVGEFADWMGKLLPL
jgi:flagellar biosynthetic protein FliR